MNIPFAFVLLFSTLKQDLGPHFLKGCHPLLMILVSVEVIVAMFAYMYLALNHIDTFGHLVGLSRDVLNLFADQLKQISPEFALRANTTLLGELDPKSILLLLIGLTVSAFGRFAGWVARRWYASATSA